MIIYQIHEYYGEYEDACDEIVGTFLHEERAVKELVALEQKERSRRMQSEKCTFCPCHNHDYESVEEIMENSRKYCSDFDSLTITDNDGNVEAIYCCNCLYNVGNTRYKIEKIEVNEEE